MDFDRRFFSVNATTIDIYSILRYNETVASICSTLHQYPQSNILRTSSDSHDPRNLQQVSPIHTGAVIGAARMIERQGFRRFGDTIVHHRDSICGIVVPAKIHMTKHALSRTGTAWVEYSSARPLPFACVQTAPVGMTNRLIAPSHRRRNQPVLFSGGTASAGASRSFFHPSAQNQMPRRLAKGAAAGVPNAKLRESPTAASINRWPLPNTERPTNLLPEALHPCQV